MICWKIITLQLWKRQHPASDPCCFAITFRLPSTPFYNSDFWEESWKPQKSPAFTTLSTVLLKFRKTSKSEKWTWSLPVRWYNSTIFCCCKKTCSHGKLKLFEVFRIPQLFWFFIFASKLNVYPHSFGAAVSSPRLLTQHSFTRKRETKWRAVRDLTKVRWGCFLEPPNLLICRRCAKSVKQNDPLCTFLHEASFSCF